MAVKVLNTSLLNTTVVAFKALPLGSYAPMTAPNPPLKSIWNWFCGMAFRAAVVLILHCRDARSMSCWQKVRVISI
jgi:hypothetical protein